MKKNIAIVLLVIAVLGMGGFIVYDKVLKKDDAKEKQTETKKLITDVKNFPTKNDDTVKWAGALSLLLYKGDSEKPITDLNENFKDLGFKTDNGVKFAISCGNYSFDYLNEDVDPKCSNVEFEFEDFNVINSYDSSNLGCGDGTNVIITDKYIIEQKESGCGGGGPITVKDKQGNTVLGVENSVVYYGSSLEDENIMDKHYGIKVVDNVLYYLSYDYDYTESYKEQYDIEFNAFDLDNMERKTIQIFQGSPAGQE